MAHIFISHSHSDWAIADSLIDFLGEAMAISKKDIRCTSDPNLGLAFSSSSISDQLKKDLNDADALIVIVTMDSLRSPWILFEVGSFWTTDKLVAPIIGPGLTFDDLPGPLKGYRSIQIEKEDVLHELNELINQLAETLEIQQNRVTRSRGNKLKLFIDSFRAWESQLPADDQSQQKEIEKLKTQIQELELVSQQEQEELKRNYQKQKEELEKSLKQIISHIKAEKRQNESLSLELERSLKAKIEQLEQQLKEEKSQNQASRNEVMGSGGELVTQASSLKPVVKTFDFEVLTVNDRGEEVKRERGQAQSLIEDLGNGINLEMVFIPGGKFMMGTEEEEIERLVKKFKLKSFRREKPQHEVTVQPFLMGKYPITQVQYQQVMRANPSSFKGDDRPVDHVSWDGAVRFCQKLSNKTGKEYRLPTEAEWEYACRAKTTTAYYFGETITAKLANYESEETTPVGQFPPNAFGLYDMHGNVWEWCQDKEHRNYEGAPNDGSVWLLNKSIINIRLIDSNVMRGGSWRTYPFFCRSACRDDEDRYFSEIGFRVVCVAPRTT